MNGRQAAKAAGMRVMELERILALNKQDIVDYNLCILHMIAGHSPCDFCEDQQECRDAGKTEINGCDDWMLRSQPAGGDASDGKGILPACEDSGERAENAECQDTPLQ